MRVVFGHNCSLWRVNATGCYWCGHGTLQASCAG